MSSLFARTEKQVSKLTAEDIKKLKESEKTIRARHAKERANTAKMYKLQREQRECEDLKRKKQSAAKREADMQWIRERANAANEKEEKEHDLSVFQKQPIKQSQKACCIIC